MHHDSPTGPCVRRFSDLRPNYDEQGVSGHELLGVAVGATISSGVVFLQDAAIPWKLWYDEVVICQSVDGRFEIELDDRVEQLNAGDMMWLPSGTSLIYRAKGKATFFFAATPADWQERGAVAQIQNG